MEYKKQTTKELIEKILSKGVRDMPTNPGALGYTEEQIKAFYYIPEKNILILISNIEDEILRVVSKSSLEVNEILSLSINHENFKIGYIESLTLTSFNRKPKMGDSFSGLCKTNDDYAYAFVATVTSVDNENSVVEVKFTKVVLLYDADFYIDVTKKLNKLIFDGNGNKFLANNGEYKEIVGGGTTVTVNGEAVEIFSADNYLKNTDIDKTYGITRESNSNKLTLTSVNDNEMNLRNSWSWSKYRAVLLSNFDHLLKLGLINNAETLTEEEKAAAQNWLGATNEEYVDNKFNGANKAVSFVNYSSMITSLNTLSNGAYSVGQNIMIVTLEVPDLWVSEVMEESATYEYVSDTDFTALLKTQGYVQVGYFKLSALETQKVDLPEYVKFTDYASPSKAGVVKTSQAHGTSMDVGGIIKTQPAIPSAIATKSNSHQPIVPKYIDDAVKIGITTNTITLTDEEKKNAQNWLGVGSYQHCITLRSYYEGEADEEITLYVTLSSSDEITLADFYQRLNGMSLFGEYGIFESGSYVPLTVCIATVSNNNIRVVYNQDSEYYMSPWIIDITEDTETTYWNTYDIVTEVGE